jgi:hypothetical protein
VWPGHPDRGGRVYGGLAGTAVKDRAEGKLAQVAGELDRWRDLARSTDF